MTLNVPFTVDTLDDWRSDTGERFEIAIDNLSYVSADYGASYENVTIDGVPVTTIGDENSTIKLIVDPT